MEKNPGKTVNALLGIYAQFWQKKIFFFQKLSVLLCFYNATSGVDKSSTCVRELFRC